MSPIGNETDWKWAMCTVSSGKVSHLMFGVSCCLHKVTSDAFHVSCPLVATSSGLVGNSRERTTGSAYPSRDRKRLNKKRVSCCLHLLQQKLVQQRCCVRDRNIWQTSFRLQFVIYFSRSTVYRTCPIIYIYIYVYMYACMYVCVYIYIYI